MTEALEKFIVRVIEENITDRKKLDQAKRYFCKENKMQMPQNDQLLEVYHKLVSNNIIPKNQSFEKLLVLKNTRSLSGIVVISVLTKPYGCPGQCIYCPTEKNVPKSYFSNEPAVMRAITCKYDPYIQTASRLKALDAVGHVTDKINIRVIGGTWSYYPRAYQTWFIKRVFHACNEFGQKQKVEKGRLPANTDIAKLQIINETAKHRIVEISIETRQDFIDKKEILHLRKLGVTKVELGVQSIYDEVLRFNQRGNTDKQTIMATKLLKDAGLKVSYQMMLNLPNSNLDKDLAMFGELFSNEDYQPDHLKIYPMALVKESGVYDLYQEGKYKPYTKEELVVLISKIKSTIPYHCRIERVIRDIPSTSIVEGGAKSSNLRQEVSKAMTKLNKKCNCIRCREIKSNFHTGLDLKVFREDYDSADGRDIFLSIESSDRHYLLSMLRLRIPSQYFSKEKHFITLLNDSALIREMHTYGPQVAIGDCDDFAAQHQGFGKKLLKVAEQIAKDEYSLGKIVVISGVGVRQFFAKQGYKLQQTYMAKELS